MRHHNNIRKFGRETGGRTALLRSLAVSLIQTGKIKTTEAKAKELRPYVEKLVTTAKKPGLPSQRLLISKLGGQNLAVRTLIDTLGPRFKDRKGGYTRIIKLPVVSINGRKESIIEFV